MRFTLRTLALRALALGIICGGFGFAAQPVHALVVPWSGAGTNPGNAPNLDGQPTVSLGDTWQVVNSGLTWQIQLNSGATPSIFNQALFSNSFGTFATVFQYTINSGVSGISPVGTQLVDVTTGKTWNAFISLANQRVTFDAPNGTQLSAGDNFFFLDINFLSAVDPSSFSFAALWSDPPNPVPPSVPEPGTLSLIGAAMLGLYVMRRRGGFARVAI